MTTTAVIDDFREISQRLDALEGDAEALAAELATHVAELRFTTFSLDAAWQLGLIAREVGVAEGLPIAVEVMVGQQVAFHTALPGANADNDAWAHRKGAVVDRYLDSSMAVGLFFDAVADGFDASSRLPEGDYVAAGGGFPLLLTTGIAVGHIAVSGLPMLHDHALAVASIRALLAQDAAPAA